MILNNIEIISTEIGNVPVVIHEKNINNKDIFDGKMLYNDLNIYIQSPTKESCLIGLKNAFELQMRFWLKEQLSETTVNL